MALRAETPRFELDVSRERNTRERASNVDVRKVERLRVEGDEAVRTDVPEIRPEVRQQFALVRLAVGAHLVELQPIDSDTNAPAGTRIQAEVFEHALPVF